MAGVQDHQNQEGRINELATKIEDLVYKTATNDSEYYKLLAERIYKLKKARLHRNELDKRNETNRNKTKRKPQWVKTPTRGHFTPPSQVP